MAADTTRLLVAGASGNLGTLALENVLARGVAGERVVATTRSPERLAEYSARGVDARRADYDDPGSLPTAFAGCDRMLLISTVEIFPEGRRFSQAKLAIDAAIEAGVHHIIYTSVGRPDIQDSPMFWETDHWQTEEYLRASSVECTILRNSEYMELHTEMLWPQAIEGDKLHTIAGDGKCSFVSRRDCAATAAAALDSDSDSYALYQVTGPETIDIGEAIAIYSEVTGRPLEVVQSTREEMTRVLAANGQPEWIIPCTLGVDDGIRGGFYDFTTDAVLELTGKAPRTLRDLLTNPGDL